MRHTYVPLLAMLTVAACSQAKMPSARTVLTPVSSPGSPVLRLLLQDVPDPAEATSSLMIAAAASRTALHVTAYQDEFALIEDVRRIELPAGSVRLRFPDVSSTLDANSVQLREVEGPGGMTVRDQLYTFDLLSAKALLARFVGREVSVRLPEEGGNPARIAPATLLAAGDDIIVRCEGKIMVTMPREVIVPDLPAGLTPEPTLEWTLGVANAGPRSAAATYLTTGLGWKAAYDLTLGPAAGKGVLATWAAITNSQVAAFPSAHLTLVAGKPNRSSRPPGPMPFFDRMATVAVGGAMPDRALDVYHAFEVDGIRTLGANSTTRIAMVPATPISLERRFVFDGDRQGAGDEPIAVQAEIALKNTEADGLGRHLPAGTVRMFTEEGGQLRFLGEDTVDHTPPGGRVRLSLGAATGLTGERRTMDQDVVTSMITRTSKAVTLRNATSSAAQVVVIEHPSGDWRVVKSSIPYERVAADEVRFNADVPAGGETRVTWTLEIVTKPVILPTAEPTKPPLPEPKAPVESVSPPDAPVKAALPPTETPKTDSASTSPAKAESAPADRR